MRVAVVSRRDDPVSLNVYAANMTRHIGALGVECAHFCERAAIPDSSDIVWDPALCMRRVPAVLATTSIPVVGTMHGVKAFSLPLEELVFGDEDSRFLTQLKTELIDDWRWLGRKAGAIVSVSRYGANEVQAAFGLDPTRVHVIYNGVDRDVFTRRGDRCLRNYFLAVASANPIKNLGRILQAHSQIAMSPRPELIVVAPGYDKTETGGDVRVISRELSQLELARLYRGAIALVFPSLRETFGLPIIEAMACGCPVLTSHDTGCAEVAGEAALLVDPRSVRAITAGMTQIMTDRRFRRQLIVRGGNRSQSFSWSEAAERLVHVFTSVITARRNTDLGLDTETEDVNRRRCQITIEDDPAQERASS